MNSSTNASKKIAWIKSVLGELTWKIYFSDCESCQMDSTSTEYDRADRNFYFFVVVLIFFFYFFWNKQNTLREVDFFMSAYLHFNRKAYLLMNNTLVVCSYASSGSQHLAWVDKQFHHLAAKPASVTWIFTEVLALFHISS